MIYVGRRYYSADMFKQLEDMIIQNDSLTKENKSLKLENSLLKDENARLKKRTRKERYSCRYGLYLFFCPIIKK